MKSSLIYFILLLIISFPIPSLSQKIKTGTEKIQILPDSAYWAAFDLVDEYEYVTTGKDGAKFYNSKELISKNQEIVKIKEMVYFPEYTSTESKKYKNVIVNEIVEFDCKNRSYRILKIEFRHDFVNLFDTINNLNGAFRSVTKGTIWDALLEYSCNLKIGAISSIAEPKRKTSCNIKSKDGIDLGDRNELVDICINSVKDKTINIKGIEIDAQKYCSCFIDNLIPQINSNELIEYAKNKNSEIFLNNEKYWQIIKECVTSNTKFGDDYKFQLPETDFANLKERLAKDCKVELLENIDKKDNITPELAEKYCSCAIDKIYSNGYNYKELSDIENKNSKAYNEVLITCINDFMGGQSGINSKSSSSDIIGNTLVSKIPLIDYFGRGYKIKLSINGITKYFLFDTGASDVIIDRDTERELLLNGSLKKENYLNKTEYILANNQIVNAQLVNVNNLKIGDFTVNNVKVAILNEGDLLCGKSLLDKFKKWGIDKEKKQITLYK